MTKTDIFLALSNTHSLVSIVGVVLSGKENYQERSGNIKHTLIFNDMWDGIFEREDDVAHEKPTVNKELAIWKIEVRRLIY